MKLRILVDHKSVYGDLSRDDVLDVPLWYASHLIKSGEAKVVGVDTPTTREGFAGWRSGMVDNFMSR